MRRTGILVAILCTALLVGGTAAAQTQTVAGDRYGGRTGDITKMVASNGTNQVVVSVFGLGKPCVGAKSLLVKIKRPTGRLSYYAEAGCYGATDWLSGLYYTSTGRLADSTKVRCTTFSLSRTATGAYRVVVPRTCLKNATDRIKVEAEGVNFGSATGGHAGPTTVLARG